MVSIVTVEGSFDYVPLLVHVCTCTYVHTCGLSCPSLAEMSLAFHELYSHTYDDFTSTPQVVNKSIAAYRISPELRSGHEHLYKYR